MERNKHGRRGLHKLRQRSNNLRYSPECGEMEMRETVRLRERMRKRERDLDSLNRNKRRVPNKVDGEESTEDSSGEEEEENETEELNNRKLSPSVRISGITAIHSKATDEMIGFPVPRKARSASVKRSHENWVAGNGGFVEEQNHMRASVSPARRSVESDRFSPSSSNASVRKKMKTNRPKTRLPKATTSSSVQEDIEIEIAEVLYGLMKQSHSSKKEDSAGNPLSMLESEDENISSTDIKPDPLVADGSKEKKVEIVDSPTPPKVENQQQAEMEICSPKEGQISGPNSVISDNGATGAASVAIESQDKQGHSKPFVEETKSVDRAVTEENFVRTEKESANSNVYFQDPTAIKLISTEKNGENQLEENFKIDLMAPPMASSPVKDSYVDIALDPNYKKVETLAKDEANVVKKEMRADDGKSKKMDTINEKRDSLNLTLEKRGQDASGGCISEQGQKQRLPKVDLSKMQQTAKSTSVPMPNGLPPLGYIPPFPSIAPMDASARSSTALQPLHFWLSQPRPKGCVMHHYIAHNIHLHQQYAKVKHFWPPTSGFASLSGAKPSKFNVGQSAEALTLGNPLVNLNLTEEKGTVGTSFAGLTRKDKSPEYTNDTVLRKQAVVQKGSQASAGNLMHDPAFIFPLNQYQTSANQPGLSKSATSASKASSTDTSAPGISTSSTVLPGVSAAVSFNYPNLAANQAPYLTIIQNNGYPFSVSTPVGNQSAIRGGTPSQALPFFNGSFNSSQMFHPQLQQQQARSQTLVQPAYQNAVPSCGSSSSHKQPESQQPQGGQVCGNKFLSSTSMHSQQLQEHKMLSTNQSRKMENEMSGEHTTANAQKKFHGQNPPFHHQPLNFALVPSAAVGGGAVDIVPQAYAMSFASFTGNNKASNLNFSSMAQNPTIFHSLPEMARQGYQVAPVPHAPTQPKNHQISDGKSGSSSANTDDGKKTSSGKSHTTNGRTYVFDNSARSLNFVSSPVRGNWPPCTVTTTTASINPPVASNSSSSHPRLLQLQKQHMAPQHHQQPATASQSKTQATDAMSASSIAAKFSSNAAIFSQTVPQCNPAAQSTPWKNSARTPASPATNVKFPHQQPLKPQGQTKISFGVNTKSGLSPQGQEIPRAAGLHRL
ncbi:Time for coffee, putative isoform 3 [Hibiscus syriacus]|uniref:Time for coffee, putative isoform 3 n=1 Tax=Hibiscus syriacus TaxID=106335 RepID=A0A6A2Z366_HIBSY|nr:protein TIME FOR COFFEE-like isoform X2 [Hibiscus syriacus]KAE8685512.1 Time for coffee, putative isoform 3 [Hibiscus syriacus]